MQALVLNLERSKSRFEFQKQQLNELGISFERINAIDATNLDECTYRKHSASWERPLRRAEVACALSHMNAWRKVLSCDLPHLILEDDALLSSCTKKIIDSLESYTDFDCVNLETRARRKVVTRRKKNLCDSFSLAGLIQDKCGAAAYVLFPSGAKLLLEWVDKNGIGLADAMLALGPKWNHGQIEPAAALQIDCCEHYGIESPIQTSTNIHNTPKPRVSGFNPFLYRRIKGQVRIGLKKTSNFFLAETIELKPFGFKTLH